MEEKDSSARLCRIEEKLDKMYEAMIALARAEEKIAAQQVSQDILSTRVTAIEAVQKSQTDQIVKLNSQASIISKTFWIFLAAFASFILMVLST